MAQVTCTENDVTLQSLFFCCEQRFETGCRVPFDAPGWRTIMIGSKFIPTPTLDSGDRFKID